MPNWVEIKVVITGDTADLESFKEAVAEPATDDAKKRSPFTFQRIIPMPPELDVSAGSDGELGVTALTGAGLAKVLDYNWAQQEGIHSQEDLVAYLNKNRPNALPLAKQYLENKEKYGFPTWYEWRIANWGTKWDACNPSLTTRSDNSLELFFETAWSFPEPVMQKLAEMFPRLTLHGTVDEEGGYFYGEVTLKDGILTTAFQEGTRKGGPFDYEDEDEED